MASIAHWLSFYTGLASIQMFCVAAIIFHVKNKKVCTLTLAIGSSLMVCGQILQFFSPYKQITLDEFEKIMTQSGPPVSWYYGSIVFSIGLLAASISFIFVATRQRLEMKDNS